MDSGRNKSFLFALLAAALYAISTPASKILLQEISPVMLAALLYLGAGIGMLAVGGLRKKRRSPEREARLGKRDSPFIAGMIVLDIAAPVFLMTGLSMTTAGNASLLNNFEIAATSLIAMMVFKEHISRRLWIAIGLITCASILLSAERLNGLSLSPGSLWILLACICWGFENNCTRMLSIKDPLAIVVIKGLGSGLGSLLIAIVLKRQAAGLFYAAAALLLGFLAYGLSIYFYVYAQRNLGAAKTSACYAVSPFIGVVLSLLIFREKPGLSFFIALLIMLTGTCLIIMDRHSHAHTHAMMTHNHFHSHNDAHHDHPHTKEEAGPHTHEHTHEKTNHSHEHDEDLHHAHTHKKQ